MSQIKIEAAQRLKADRVKPGDKEYDAIYIDDWTRADMKAAAEESGVGLKGAPLHSSKQAIMKKGRHFVIHNFKEPEELGGRFYKRHFATPAWVEAYKVKSD